MTLLMPDILCADNAGVKSQSGFTIPARWHRPRQRKAADTPGAALASTRFCLVMSLVQFLARAFVLWPGRSHALVLARQRRVRRASPTRLPVSRAQRPRLRCDVHIAIHRSIVRDECQSVPGGPSWSGAFVTGDFSVLPGHSHVLVLARHRRVRRASPTRLTDYRPLPHPVARPLFLLRVSCVIELDKELLLDRTQQGSFHPFHPPLVASFSLPAVGGGPLPALSWQRGATDRVAEERQQAQSAAGFGFRSWLCRGG